MTQLTIKLAEQPRLVSRKQLATMTGVRASTLMYYSNEGLLPFRQEGVGLMRRYVPQEAKIRLEEIEDLQSRGLSIDQIKERLASR